MKAGELRELITVQKPTRVQNPSGGYSTEYTDILKGTYAKVTEVSASSEIIASQEDITSLVEFVIRYRPTEIKIGYRILWRDFIFTVAKQMKVDFLRTAITITAKSEIETTLR